MQYAVFQSTWLLYCLSSMFDLDAICRGRTSFGGHCFSSEVDFEWKKPVAGPPLLLYVFFQKSTLNAICGVPEHLAILLFAFDA